MERITILKTDRKHGTFHYDIPALAGKINEIIDFLNRDDDFLPSAEYWGNLHKRMDEKIEEDLLRAGRKLKREMEILKKEAEAETVLLEEKLKERRNANVAFDKWSRLIGHGERFSKLSKGECQERAFFAGWAATSTPVEC
jgi:hypothetical protein